MGDLKEWVKKNSPYIKLEEGDSFTGIYKGYKESAYRGSPLIEYAIDDKVLGSSSNKLAMRMDGIKPGAKIKIIRFGTGPETNYEVEVLSDAQKTEWEKEDETQQKEAWDE